MGHSDFPCCWSSFLPRPANTHFWEDITGTRCPGMIREALRQKSCKPIRPCSGLTGPVPHIMDKGCVKLELCMIWAGQILTLSQPGWVTKEFNMPPPCSYIHTTKTLATSAPSSPSGAGKDLGNPGFHGSGKALRGKPVGNPRRKGCQGKPVL